jgi:CRP/FNR family transcriptional regulator, cyclic AMP receptor protein
VQPLTPRPARIDETDAEASDHTDLLRCLPPAERAALLFEGERRHHPRGTALVTEGRRGGDVLILVRGRAAIERGAPSGRRIIVAVCQPGSIVGEVAAIDGGYISATVRALETVETVAISGARFRRLVRDYPAVADVVLRLLCARLREADRRLVEFGAGDAVGRVCARVADLAVEHGQVTGEGIRVTLPLSQDELAGYTGLSREAVSRVLSTLRRRGWISTARRAVVVHDLDALRRESRR